MAQFRKKPVVIEAFQLPHWDDLAALDTFHEWADQTGFTNWVSDHEGIIVYTLEGDLLARPGDWIIKGVAGEFYPCKPDIFAATYEAAGDGAEAKVYTHRNGETTPPELSENEFTSYWFDGIAHYEDWKKKGDLIVATGKHADRVVGLVTVAMMIDMKHPIKSGNFIERNRPTMFVEVESTGYDLDKCEGRWWGPVHVPPLSHDLISSTAAVMNYEEWKKFQSDFESIRNDDNQATPPPS